MVVGRGEVACFLSRVVSVGGELYTISVSPDGARLDYAPYEGPAGSLDLATELDTDGKLLALVVRSADGEHSFDLAKARTGMRLPAGSYNLHSGRIGLGEATVEVRPGRARPFEIAPGAELVPVWGGPVEAEFRYRRAGGELAISPDEVRFFGSLGEEYTGWAPRGDSPEFRVSERELGTELTKGIFPGSCCGHGFIPVAMSVPADADISISMTVDTWAFGEIAGFPVGQGVSSPEARE
jgi:hypothetical protein